jgi:fermentation-respiration switch protein FrsA (DUF1100 family)
MRTEVEFRVEDGTLLRGFLHTPEDGRPSPGIVMAHGFSGVKEQIDHYAAAFSERGFSVLVYDHRGFGSSEGAPRFEVDPYRQIADWRDALTYVSGHPAFDLERGLGVWGSSFAGGLAIVIAANDPRVSVVVAQIPNVSGHLNTQQMFGPRVRRRLREMFDEDRRNRIDGGAPAMIPVFSADPDELCALPPVVRQRFINSGYEDAPSWSNEVTLRSVENMMDFEVMGWVEHVAPKPLLMIVGAKDNVTFPEIQLRAFESAREPKKAYVHPGGHFQTYHEPYFEGTCEAAGDWFELHLALVGAAERSA